MDLLKILSKHKQELIRFEGYGEKSVTSLIEAIENSKNNSLERLIFGLGILHVGLKKAKILSQHYKNIDNLINASLDELQEIDDIGLVIAKSIKNYFSDNDNIVLINKLKELNVNMNYLGKEVSNNSKFYNKTFVLTGSLSLFTRDEARDLIESFGGKTTDSVSKKTSVVIVGDNPGSKYEKAKNLGIEIWSEEDFSNYLNN